MPFRRLSRSIAACLLSFAAASPSTSYATIVEFETALGNFEVNLYDNATPKTVANFLDYVQNGRYSGSIVHRSVPGFVVQGGGFNTNAKAEIGVITTGAAVTNEPLYANVRGTIAMAKLAGDPNSATSQWFFNLADNTTELDGQNGGFTVFGEVTGNGMTVIDAVAALPVYDTGTPLTELPLRNYTATDAANNVPIDNTHLVTITAITVTDSTVNSAAGLSPLPNTASNNNSGNGGNGGGGSIGWIVLLGICAVRLLCPLPVRARKLYRSKAGNHS